jgi:hypothetical protein
MAKNKNRSSIEPPDSEGSVIEPSELDESQIEDEAEPQTEPPDDRVVSNVETATLYLPHPKSRLAMLSKGKPLNAGQIKQKGYRLKDLLRLGVVTLIE